MLRRVLLLGLALFAVEIKAAGLTPDQLGLIYNRNDPASGRIAQYYSAHRNIPPLNVIGLSVPESAVINRAELAHLRTQMLAELPSNVQSLLLIWSKPHAVECMSITTAMAAGFQPGFCEPGCAGTSSNPLFDSGEWLPADTAGWLPAMLLPSEDEAMARALIDRGIKADASRPIGTVYLVRTQDAIRNVRAVEYSDAEALVSRRVLVRQLTTPIERPPSDILAYFTGTTRVDELAKLGFRPGAVADHLTSTGGVLQGGNQMSAMEWLRQGATGSYGSVSEPCNRTAKFPNPAVFMNHYLRGDTLLEAYWKSVEMPGQGLFIGEPLARPYGDSHQARPAHDASRN
jgi:uncharacterized protein (TIGR03790 family)